MILYNPAFCVKDFLKPSDIVTKYRNLAICVSYVTAKFVPGASSVRRRLFPAVLGLVQRFLTEDIRDDAQGVPTLNGLMLLLAYSDIPANAASTVAEDNVERELMFWPLKSLTESYAVRIQCHRAVQHLNTAIERGQVGLSDTPAFKKYCCWIWLFNMAH
jgi:hypothetical protein